jgi:hypothetical protein
LFGSLFYGSTLTYSQLTNGIIFVQFIFILDGVESKKKYIKGSNRRYTKGGDIVNARAPRLAARARPAMPPTRYAPRSTRGAPSRSRASLPTLADQATISHHYHQPINVPTAEAQALLMDHT